MREHPQGGRVHILSESTRLVIAIDLDERERDAIARDQGLDHPAGRADLVAWLERTIAERLKGLRSA